MPTAVYRVDFNGRVDRVATEDQVPDPNGLAFSPDHRTLYVASTGRGPGDTGPALLEAHTFPYTSHRTPSGAQRTPSIRQSLNSR